MHANARGAALLASLTLKRLTVDDIAPRGRVRCAVSTRSENTRGLRHALYREFRAIYKQNKAIYARLNAMADSGDTTRLVIERRSSRTAASTRRTTGSRCRESPREEILRMMEAMRGTGGGSLGGRLRVGQRLQRRSRAHRVPERGVRAQFAGEPAARRSVAEHGEVRGRDRRDGRAHARWRRRRLRHGELGRHREHPAGDEGVSRPRLRTGHRPARDDHAVDRARRVRQGRRLLPHHQGDRAGRARRPGRCRRDGSCDHAEHGGDRRFGAVLPERARRPDLRAVGSSRVARDIGFHTDACLGGFVLPWAERLGYECRRSTSASRA